MTSYAKHHITYVNEAGDPVAWKNRYGHEIQHDKCKPGENCFLGRGAAIDYLQSELWHRSMLNKNTAPSFDDIHTQSGYPDPENTGYSWKIQAIEHIDFF